MEISIGRGKTARRAYGIDEIALVPGQRTLDPSLADTQVADWRNRSRNPDYRQRHGWSSRCPHGHFAVGALGAMGVTQPRRNSNPLCRPPANIRAHRESVGNHEFVSA